MSIKYTRQVQPLKEREGRGGKREKGRERRKGREKGGEET